MTKSIDVAPTWYWPDGVPRDISMPRAPVHRAVLERWARRSPESVALQSREAAVDYRGLLTRTEAMSAGIQRLRRDRSGGSAEHFRIALLTSWGVDGIAAVLGALHAGVDALLVDPSTPPAAIRALMERYRLDDLVAACEGDSRADAAVLDPRDANATSEAVGVESAGAGRLGLRWGDAVVFHPGEPLLAWAQAFRTFAELDKDELFTVYRPLASWEGLIGLLAPMTVGMPCLLPTGMPTDQAPLGAGGRRGIWVGLRDVDTFFGGGPGREAWEWMYVSVTAPWSVRDRRRLARLANARVLTIFGTPATGPVVASHRSWFIEEAAGIPMTGVELFPVDHRRQVVAEPPWPLLAFAAVGVKSSLVTHEMSLEGPAPGGFVNEDVFDTGVLGRIDANGFLYLVS